RERRRRRSGRRPGAPGAGALLLASVGRACAQLPRVTLVLAPVGLLGAGAVLAVWRARADRGFRARGTRSAWGSRRRTAASVTDYPGGGGSMCAVRAVGARPAPRMIVV